MAAVPSRVAWCEERCSPSGHSSIPPGAMWRQRPSPDQQQRKLPGQALGTALIYNLTQACKSRATNSSSGTQRSCDDVQCFLKIKNRCSFIEINYIAYGPFSVESMCFSTSWSCAAVRTVDTEVLLLYGSWNLVSVPGHSSLPWLPLPWTTPGRLLTSQNFYFDIVVIWMQLSSNMATFMSHVSKL